MTDFFIKYVKFTKKDLYFGMFLLIVAYFLNDISNSLNGYLKIEIPHFSNKNDAFYYKKMPDGRELILYLKQNDDKKLNKKELFYVIKKGNKVITRGYCVIPSDYYFSNLILHINKDGINCLIGKDYLSKEFEEKQLKILEEYAKNHKLNE